MKIYIVLKADYCEWSTEYGYSNVVSVKYRENQAKNKVQELKDEDGENYYYEEIYISLTDIPTIANNQFGTLADVDAYNSTEQLNEVVIASRIKEMEELKKEIRGLKTSVARESARANRAESIRAKTEQELRTIRNTIRAAKKIDKPQFLGFEDDNGEMHWIDPNNNCRVLTNNGLSISISELRRDNGNLKPVYAASPAEQDKIIGKDFKKVHCNALGYGWWTYVFTSW